MELFSVLLMATYFIVQVVTSPVPDPSHHHVVHRIHVPHKIKTIYRTKIIKVPEHHHHFHEKEKIIIEKEKKHHDPIYPPLHEDEVGHHDEYEFSPSEHHKVYEKVKSSSTEHTSRKPKPKIKRKRRGRLA